MDGRTASGKTSFADELAAIVGCAGRPVIRASIDGFHRPRAVRYRRGRLSPDGYYENARDLEAFRRLLLDPLGPDGDGLYIASSFDLQRDEPVDLRPQQAPADAVLIADGTFLQRAELKPAWDFVIFLDVPKEEARRRCIARDGPASDEASVAQLYDLRYAPAFARYETECGPAEEADMLFPDGAVS